MQANVSIFDNEGNNGPFKVRRLKPVPGERASALCLEMGYALTMFTTVERLRELRDKINAFLNAESTSTEADQGAQAGTRSQNK